MEKKRFIWADSMKGWLIILVVLGHAIQTTLGADCESSHLWNLIYSFHMPAFMAVSGYLTYRANEIGSVSGFKTVLFRRFLQLMVPFFVWTTLLILINRVDPSWSSIMTFFYYPDKGLWFLWVLFFINVFFVAGSWLGDRLKLKKEIVILFICLLLIGVMVAFEPRLFGFQFIAYYFLFYSLGYYLHKYEDRIVTNNLFLIAILTLCWFALAWFWKMHELPFWLQSIPLPVSLVQYTYRFITAAIAIYVLLAVSPRVLNINKGLNRPFVKLGTISLGIYTTHFILIGRIAKLFANSCLSESMRIIVSFVVALSISWAIVWLLSKWKFTAKYMLGKI